MISARFLLFLYRFVRDVVPRARSLRLRITRGEFATGTGLRKPRLLRDRRGNFAGYINTFRLTNRLPPPPFQRVNLKTRSSIFSYVLNKCQSRSLHLAAVHVSQMSSLISINPHAPLNKTSKNLIKNFVLSK